MRKSLSVVALVATMALAGCMRTGMSDIDTADVRPQPLEAQPVTSVQSGQLPDPTVDPTAFPEKPVVDPTAQASQTVDVASANGLDIKKETMVGGWKVTQGGAGCDMFLTLTNLGSGSRGGTRGCAADLTKMASWEVAGKQVLLKDRDGNVIARLYKSAENRFDGATAGGQQLSLNR